MATEPGTRALEDVRLSSGEKRLFSLAKVLFALYTCHASVGREDPSDVRVARGRALRDAEADTDSGLTRSPDQRDNSGMVQARQPTHMGRRLNASGQ
jgi:hypothetical protein